MAINEYIKSNDIYYDGVLREISKSNEHLQPIFEAFTNCLESIKFLNIGSNGCITIKMYYDKTLTGLTFKKVAIEDNGVGFDEVNFTRFQRYKDDQKGYNNKGSGRIQLIHFFNQSEFTSIFKTDEGFSERTFTLSKNFLRFNAIIFNRDLKSVAANQVKTILEMKTLNNEKDQKFYDKLELADLKDKIIKRYMMMFCTQRENLPKIDLIKSVNDIDLEHKSITITDIPNDVNSWNLHLSYYTMSDEQELVETEKKAELKITTFKLDYKSCTKNEIKFTSKDEIVDNVKIELSCLKPTDKIENCRYLFLISGSYINERDSDSRGFLKIPKKDEFIDSSGLFRTEELLMDDIQEKANSSILDNHDEIKKCNEEILSEVEELKKMFLLSDDAINSLKINTSDSDSKILEKVYTAEMKTVAKKDAEIKSKIDDLKNLNPADFNYQKTFDSMISDLVKTIPLQNRTALTHYVARRKLVLELFDKILANELAIQETNKRNIDEKLLHNLIFQQSSDNPDQSDLWVVNEDFIYFKGISEGKLKDIEVNGKKILKEILTPEEEKYRTSLGEDRLIKKPDILLFPDEGKCIIIEFKNPNVNVSENLLEITRYASIIMNLSKEEFRFNTFYGYLIGEMIDPDDVRDHDGDFKHAYHFDYLFRSHKSINGRFNRQGQDGSLYTEVIKYSTLLARAKKRNEIFINKLTENYSTNK